MYTEELSKRGWSKERQCHCSGTLEEIFKNQSRVGYTVNVFPNKNRFEVYNGAKKIHSGEINKLNEYLITYK